MKKIKVEKRVIETADGLALEIRAVAEVEKRISEDILRFWQAEQHGDKVISKTIVPINIDDGWKSVAQTIVEENLARTLEWAGLL